MGAPRWGSASFESSIAAMNPWASRPPMPVVEELHPVAPEDRLDGQSSSSVLGAVAAEPSASALRLGVTDGPPPPAVKSDFVPEFSQPRTFPEEQASPDEVHTRRGAKSILNINERSVVSPLDRLRRRFGSVALYPPVPPADRLPGGRVAVAPQDKIPEDFARYLEQVNDQMAMGAAVARMNAAVEQADTNMDSAISPQEFKNELLGRQNKTAEEAERLWNKFHQGDSRFMGREEYTRLVRVNYDLGTINRSDVSSVLEPPAGSVLGFWGSGPVCPPGRFVTAVQLKVMGTSQDADADNTALNSVGLRCDDGSEFKSIEGTDGSWSAWAACPAGQYVFSVRARTHTGAPGMDGSGINDLEFGCRAPDLSAFSKLRFGQEVAKPPAGVVVGVGEQAKQGGWSQEFRCSAKATICGAQVNVLRDQAAQDDAGVAGLRFYCCDRQIDCSNVCSGAANGFASAKCNVCRRAASSS